MKNTKTRQSIRSIKMLQESFLNLLKDKSFDKIKIIEITENADLARSTFYAHFDTKNDLVESFFDEIFNKYTSVLMEEGELSVENEEDEIELQSNIFRYWKENHEVFSILIKLNIDRIILSRLKIFYNDLYDKKVSKLLSDPNPKLAGYYNRFLTATTYALILQWTEDGLQISPEIMGALLHSLTGPEMTHKIYNEFAEKIK